MKANKVGEYAQEVTIETEGTEEGVTLNIPNVELLLSYLPDGAFKNLEEQRIQYEDGNTGAGTIIHYTLYRMDQGAVRCRRCCPDCAGSEAGADRQEDLCPWPYDRQR